MTNEFDLLFARLEWPSGLVRERACLAIAELLCDPSESEITFAYLKDWIKAQKLESISLYGLIILHKARSIKPDLCFPEDVTSNIFKPSILTNLLLIELGMLPQDLNHSFFIMEREEVPKSHEKFFARNLKVYPGAYIVERIDQKTGNNFSEHWLHEWSNIVSELNLKLSRESFNYWGREDSEHYSVFDVMFSEIYRSAFLRSLAWAVNQHGFNLHEAIFLALRNCPVDLGLWNVKVGNKPDDWPFVEKLESEIDTTPSKIWNQVNELWSKQQTSKNNLVHASGIVHTSDNLVYHLQIIGVLQKCIGKEEPDIEEIHDHLERGFGFGPSKLVFNGRLKKEEIEGIQSGDWLIMPLTKNIWPATIPRWQFWRMNSIYLPHGALTEEPLEYECTEESIQILKYGAVIGEWKDWMYGFTEKTEANLPPNTGSVLDLNKEIIQSLCEEMEMTFSWLCKISCFSREYSYEKYKTTHFYDKFGGTNIILP
ncbi:hypothetical protein [Paenibacillus sp. SYP-B4298]|uniref:hypothetical protein n=1 Tax=Paenibacillus sp. SYP-B4298 TaxID=2996034 RepID=UPI0022DD20B0|nr:hypothetical protein [Paenibacillus sp. SYP-B4298]